jgi:predicted dithiol-disulfide oxidoreductase (DUF899 family)
MTDETVTREEWLAARRELLVEEKKLTRLRDEVSAKRRALPRVEIDKAYTFTGPDGEESLADLFGERSQLVIYHFMYGPEWDEGCPSCSFWADNFERIDVHLAARDISLVAVSRAEYGTLDAYRRRMGWTFKWVSSRGSDFNRDFGVTFTAEERESGEKIYNFGTLSFGVDEAPGISVFSKDDAGRVFHTYSTYARGLDMLNGAYHYMDLTPKGRDEAGLPYTMAWLRRRDQYE